MYDYEIALIIRPEVEEEGQAALIERLGELLTSEGGEVADVETWGRRRLAYPIRNFTEGYYVMFEAKVDPTRFVDIERNMQYTEDILRYLVVRKEEK